MHVVKEYEIANLLDSHKNAPVHIVVQTSPHKSCVITVSGVHTNSFLTSGLDSGAQMMAAYILHFLAVISRSGSTRPPMIRQHPLQACEVFVRWTRFSAASLVFQMSTGSGQAISWYLLYLRTASPFALALTKSMRFNKMRYAR